MAWWSSAMEHLLTRAILQWEKWDAALVSDYAVYINDIYIYMGVSATKKGHQWWVQCKLCLASPTLPDAGAKDLSHAKSSPLYSYVLQKAGFGEAHLQKKHKTHSSVLIKLCICQQYESIFEKIKLESKNSRTAMLRIQVFVEPKSCWNMSPRTASRVIANNLQDKSCYMIQA